MPERLRVVALTGGEAVPSARFRVEQLVPALARSGVDVELRTARISSFPPRARWLRPLWLPATVLARLPDIAATHGGPPEGSVTLLQREFVSTLTTLEFATARPRVLDVDDAIWLRRGGRFAARLAQQCRVVVAGNAYLADWFARHCERVEVLPTAIDTVRFAPASPAAPADRPPAVGWIGTAPNYASLLLWREALCDLLAERPGLRLRLCAEAPPPRGAFPSDRVDWVPWSPAAEVPFLQSLDVGLMPLADSPWARGKCSFKLLQYLACGVPAVASPVGMNADVLAGWDELAGTPQGAGPVTGDQAGAALARFLDAADARRAGGLAGRCLVQERYSVEVVAPRLAAVLRSAAASPGRRS